MNIRKMIAGICITVGIALLAVPFFYHFRGKEKTDALLTEFEQKLEDGDNEETIESGDSAQAAGDEEKKALLEESGIKRFVCKFVLACLEVQP